MASYPCCGGAIREPSFDPGGTRDGVLAGLEELSSRPLPDSLIRLVADVARRHGHLVVEPTGAVITSEDAALLAELLSTPGLRPLGLRTLAPGALMADAPAGRTLEVLRSNGYLPVRRR